MARLGSTLCARERVLVAERYGATRGALGQAAHCAYCGVEGLISWFARPTQRYGWVSLRDLEWDHVVPLVRGGENTAANVVLACRRCNRSKGSRLL